jgi:hypothetical protein
MGFSSVASGGGYKSFYTAGSLVWLKKQDLPIIEAVGRSHHLEG